MPGTILRSASLAVLRSIGSWPMDFMSLLAGGVGALGAWAQAAGALSAPTENRATTSNAIDRFMRCPPAEMSELLANPQQLHLEDQGRPARNDPAGPAVTVTQVRGDDQLALAAHLHGDDALVPALDDPALAHRELERRAA